jgi:two-component system sensor histidine kinase KdpD
MDESLPSRRGRSPVAGYALALAGAVGAVVAAALAKRWFGLEDLSLVFIVAVLLVASRTSTGPAIATSLLCFAGYNFFFFEPRYTFYISARDGVATIALFLAAALIAGRLASRLAMRVEALREANAEASMRQRLGLRLAAATSEEQIVSAARDAFETGFDAQAWVRLDPSPGGRQGAAPGEHGWWFLPLATADARLGTVGLKLAASQEEPDAAQRRVSKLLAEDIAQALWRVRLATELEAQRVANEAERLRSALLASVSHDLRTPLAGMLGAAESLENYGDVLGDADRRALLQTVREDGRRLDRYIQNLLDMTRIGGGITLSCDWIGVDELIGSALGRLRRYQPGVQCTVEWDGAVEPVWVQPALLEQAIFNVVENAVKFSPPGRMVAIRVRQSGDRLRIEVVDDGPGIPEEDRKRVFEMFYSAGRGDRHRHGTGLGLAICRGIAGAHGGSIEALAGPGGKGTLIRIDLPLARPQAGDGQ